MRAATYSDRSSHVCGAPTPQPVGMEAIKILLTPCNTLLDHALAMGRNQERNLRHTMPSSALHSEVTNTQVEVFQLSLVHQVPEPTANTFVRVGLH